MPSGLMVAFSSSEAYSSHMHSEPTNDQQPPQPKDSSPARPSENPKSSPPENGTPFVATSLCNLGSSASIKAWGEQFRKDVKAEIARLEAEDRHKEELEAAKQKAAAKKK